MMFVSTTVCQKRLNVYVYSISTFSNAPGLGYLPLFCSLAIAYHQGGTLPYLGIWRFAQFNCLA